MLDPFQLLHISQLGYVLSIFSALNLGEERTKEGHQKVETLILNSHDDNQFQVDREPQTCKCRFCPLLFVEW